MEGPGGQGCSPAAGRCEGEEPGRQGNPGGESREREGVAGPAPSAAAGGPSPQVAQGGGQEESVSQGWRPGRVEPSSSLPPP